MMTNADRAKIFAPFDAVKGLQEALRKREEQHVRVQKSEVSEDIAGSNSRLLSKLERGMEAEVFYYCNFHNITERGTVSDVNFTMRYLKIDSKKIWFDDIYSLKIL